MKHPLLNNESKHYNTDMKATIYHFESTISVASMVDVCEFEIFKYKSRLGKKEFKNEKGVLISREDVKMSDLKKIETWKAYKDLLYTVLHSHSKLSVRQALDEYYPDLEYSL